MLTTACNQHKNIPVCNKTSFHPVRFLITYPLHKNRVNNFEIKSGTDWSRVRRYFVFFLFYSFFNVWCIQESETETPQKKEEKEKSPGPHFTKLVISHKFNDSFCYKLLKSLLLIVHQQIFHWFLPFIIEKKALWNGSLILFAVKSWQAWRHHDDVTMMEVEVYKIKRHDTLSSNTP